jgi:biotin carboxyl carrier protein
MGTDEREAADRLADHAAIDSLANELIPALIAKLGASGLGEIEVREGDWKVRLRRPAEGTHASGRKVGDRGGRATPGAVGGAGAAGVVGTAGRPQLTPVGPGRQSVLDEAEALAVGAAFESDGSATGDPSGRAHDPFRAMATSPAVGFYQPRTGVVPGSRVRSGDPIGSIDVLGIPTEVVAPADGIVGASLVEPGEAVEYGQDLVWIELLSAAPATDAATRES